MESNSLKWSLNLFIIGTILSVFTISTSAGIFYLYDFGILLITAGWLFLIDDANSKYFNRLLSLNIAIWLLMIANVFLSHLETTQNIKILQMHLVLQSYFTIPLSVLSFCFMMIELSIVKSLTVTLKRWKIASKMVLLIYGLPAILTFSLYIGFLFGKVEEYNFFIKPFAQSNQSVSDLFIGILILGIVLFPIIFVFYSLYKTSKEISVLAG